MLVYFAGPLFCEAERRFNSDLTAKLEALGFQVFLPQRDGAERTNPQYQALRPDEWERAVFALDKERLLAADVVLVVLDGRVPDEGACVELGIAYAQRELTHRKKLLIGYQTDRRAAFPERKLNAMIRGAIDRVESEEAALLAVLEHYQSQAG
jgi:nucleoside 2-deoxyribosyltransferase